MANGSGDKPHEPDMPGGDDILTFLGASVDVELHNGEIMTEFQGEMDDVRIWGGAAAVAQVPSLMQVRSQFSDGRSQARRRILRSAARY